MVNLQETYKKIYLTFPWPKPIPRPKEVTITWNPRFTRLHGRCWPTKKFIEVNTLYQDRRLQGELEHLMAHEAAHFLWGGHPQGFKAFLRSVGVPEEYVHSSGPTSELYRAVVAERRPPRYTWQCPGCGRFTTSQRLQNRSCGRCDPKWNPQFKFVLVKEESQRILGQDVGVNKEAWQDNDYKYQDGRSRYSGREKSTPISFQTEELPLTEEEKDEMGYAVLETAQEMAGAERLPVFVQKLLQHTALAWIDRKIAMREAVKLIRELLPTIPTAGEHRFVMPYR